MVGTRVGNADDNNWTYAGSSTDVPSIMVFRPTWEEFKDFNKYLQKIEDLGAHKAGLAKIIPPKEWIPRRSGYNLRTEKDLANMKIPSPICQVVTGNRGIYQSINVQKKSMTVKEYVDHVKKGNEPPKYSTYEELERKYWKNITFIAPLYGADVWGSITDESCDSWNINRLGSILDCVNQDYGIEMPGVNTAYLYFGSWKTTFAWHTEDMDLHSINYLHFGDAKFWYTIPPRFMRRFERLADGLFPQLKKECSSFLRHKMCLISPSLLRQHSIPYNKIVQQKGEIMITFPCGYHSGFNTGFNCAESTNFATPRWVEYGKRASRCYCKPDTVNISMDCFVKRFQPEKYNNWLEGKDLGYHPVDDPKTTSMSLAPPPSAEEFLVNKTNQRIPDCILNPTSTTKKKPLRHPIHRSMAGTTNLEDKQRCEGEQTKPYVDESDDSDEDEEAEEGIDDYDYEALEDIWKQSADTKDYPSPGKKRTHSSNTTADESNHEQIKTESNINKRNPTSKAGASKQITASVNKRRSFTEQKTSNTAVISSDLEVKSSDNDKASKVVNKLPESKKGLVVGEQELAAVASNHFTKQEADHCKKESRSNVVSNQQVKTSRRKRKLSGSSFITNKNILLESDGMVSQSSSNSSVGNPTLNSLIRSQPESVSSTSRTSEWSHLPASHFINWVRTLSSAGNLVLPQANSSLTGATYANSSQGSTNNGGGSAVVTGQVQASTVTSPMVRMNYSKKQKEGGEGGIVNGDTASKSNGKPSLSDTIARLKGKLGCDEQTVSTTQSSFNFNASLGSVESSNDPGHAEQVLNLLMALGLPPTQPLALFDRTLCNLPPGTNLSHQETESLVLLLLSNVHQFAQLQSQLSPTHQQILRLAAKSKHAENPEYWNRLLSHLRLLSSAQLVYLTHQLTRYAAAIGGSSAGGSMLTTQPSNVLHQLKCLSE